MKSVCSLGEDTVSMLEQRTAKHETMCVFLCNTIKVHVLVRRKTFADAVSFARRG